MNARFCSSCGVAVRGAAATPESPPDGSRMWAAGVFLGLLAVGALALYSAQGVSEPPARAVPGSPTGGSAEGATQPLPPEHPPIELPSEAVALLDQLTEEAERAPDDLEAWQRLARGRYRAALIDPTYVPGAKAAIARVLELDPDNLEALRTHGNLSYDLRDYPDAERYLRRYLELDPSDPGVKTDLASSRLFQGDRESAKQLYREVIASNPAFVQAHLNLGIALHADGDREAANASLQEALSHSSTPEQKDQVERIIGIVSSKSQAHSETATPPAAATNASASFQREAEEAFRSHPIVGPKIQSFEWTAPMVGSAKLRGFPMDQMPPVMRNKFKSRINELLAEAKSRDGSGEKIRITLVDDETGNVMDTLDGTEWVGAFDEVE